MNLQHRESWICMHLLRFCILTAVYVHIMHYHRLARVLYAFALAFLLRFNCYALVVYCHSLHLVRLAFWTLDFYRVCVYASLLCCVYLAMSHLRLLAICV